MKMVLMKYFILSGIDVNITAIGFVLQYVSKNKFQLLVVDQIFRDSWDIEQKI